ncbi:MAG: lysophospholipid acyltransferase family protein [Planctomycetota bacterium]
MTGLRLEVRDRDHLHRLRLPCVFVANHTSKLDAIVLLAALPLRFAFVAKSELARSAFLRWPLHRLGTLFVDRHPRHSNGSATAQAIARLRQGDSLFFFPEGTFGDVPGLLAFHRGAFVAAANAGADVVPIALRGTRDVLPDLRRLPRRGSLEVAVGAPIDPTEPEASPRSPEQMAAASLRQARAFIARGCGEPDLARPETEPRSGTS